MTTAQKIDPNQIKEQALRIAKSPEFKRSKILSDFLKYVVRETLEGNGENLKEYVITTDVLNKSTDFNPQLDAEATNQDLVDLQIESIPTVAVLPFDCLRDKSSGEVICSVRARDLTIGLSYFNELKVISNHAAVYAKENLSSWKDMVPLWVMTTLPFLLVVALEMPLNELFTRLVSVSV